MKYFMILVFAVATGAWCIKVYQMWRADVIKKNKDKEPERVYDDEDRFFP